MARVLTAKSIEAARPDPTKRIEISDGLLPAMRLVVQPTGATSWAVRYRIGKRPRKVTLGRYPALSWSDARDAAREALRAMARGEDPAAEKGTSKGQTARRKLQAWPRRATRSQRWWRSSTGGTSRKSGAAPNCALP